MNLENKISDNNNVKNKIKKGIKKGLFYLFLGGFLGVSALVGCGQKQKIDYLKKLPEGSVRVDYEKLTDSSPSELYHDSYLKTKAIKWSSKWYSEGILSDVKESAVKIMSNISPYHIIAAVHSDIKIGYFLTPDNGIPEAFIVPRVTEKDLFLHIFMDKECYEKFKEPEIAFLGDFDDERSTYIGKLKFQKKYDIFTAHINRPKIRLYSEHGRRFRGYLIGNFKQKNFDKVISEKEATNILEGDYLIVTRY